MVEAGIEMAENEAARIGEGVSAAESLTRPPLTVGRQKAAEARH